MKSLQRTAKASIVTLALVFTPGCGDAGFLALADYQRDLFGFGINALTSGIGDAGTLAAAILFGGGGGQAGPPGPPGPPGVQGPAGSSVPGSPGPQGDPGGQGDPGAAGQDGQDGQSGADGQDGADGQNGQNGADGQDGADGQNGQNGADGQDGPPGPTLFDIFIEDFFGEDFIGSLPVQFVSIFEPPIGVDPFSGPTRAAFRVAIPPSYQGLNPVTLRLFLRRDSQTPPVAGSLEFNIFGKRLIDASGTFDDYLNPAGRNVTVDPSVSAAEFKLIDLPLNTSPDGLGGGPLAAGQFLAFEIGATADDGASYILLGAELYETETAPPVSGATINP